MQQPTSVGAEVLLDLVFRRDCGGLAALFHQDEMSRWPESTWLFHRWDKQESCFVTVYPEHLEGHLPVNIRHRLENQKCLVDNNIPEFYGDWEGTAGYPFTVLLPLIYNSDFTGAVQGFSSHGDGWWEWVQAASAKLSLLAQCWQLVSFLEENEKLAFTDPLTGLFNYKYLRQFLQNQLTRCARYHQALSVLFLDVDWFKRVNDRHGHLLGSYVLKELGGVLRKQVREADIVARYGGDEFVIVLMESDQHKSLQIAERLREVVSQFVFGRKQGHEIRLTISAGIASFPENGMTVDELILRSDRAMYLAKEDHKNCVKIAV
ncbi:MAG: GGDEF domain-containing protein [Acidobacteria bacterium]|nr:GGDEF domain-containing protein [Acidobacteriota bacterium]